GRLNRLSLTQRDVLGEGGMWPLSTQVGLHYRDGKVKVLRVNLKANTAVIKEAERKECPGYIFANDGDYGYGRFLLDSKSRAAALEHLGSERDLFEKTLL